ncbi:MAG TPA: hypothetical protein VHW66_21065 [Stellaceae bacterium]|jgi:hypothetical protein|nr:hypothetical protein [Stellaceae bacterium]
MDAPISQYLTRPLRTLAAVCHALGRDDYGRACTECVLKDLCDPQSEQQPATREAVGARPATVPVGQS